MNGEVNGGGVACGCEVGLGLAVWHIVVVADILFHIIDGVLLPPAVLVVVLPEHNGVVVVKDGVEALSTPVVAPPPIRSIPPPRSSRHFASSYSAKASR